MNTDVFRKDKEAVRARMSALFSTDQRNVASAVLVFLDGMQIFSESVNNQERTDHWDALIQYAAANQDDDLKKYAEEMARNIVYLQERSKSSSSSVKTQQPGYPNAFTDGLTQQKDERQVDKSIHQAVTFRPATSIHRARPVSYMDVRHVSGVTSEDPKLSRADQAVFSIAVVGRQQVGKSLLIRQLQQRYERANQVSLSTTVAPDGFQLLTAALTPTMVISELPPIGLANATAAHFYKAMNLKSYNMIILLVGNRFREYDQALIESASTGSHRCPVLIVKVINKEIDSNPVVKERNISAPIEQSLVEITAFLNRQYYSNASVFAVNLWADFANDATLVLQEQQFLQRMEMHYGQYINTAGGPQQGVQEPLQTGRLTALSKAAGSYISKQFA